MLKNLKTSRILIGLLGSFILAFGLYNIHSLSGVTEGGALGLTLLLDHWFGISPAFSGLILNILCYAFGFKTLGKEFMKYSVICGLGFSLSYKICEIYPPIYPEIAQMPLVASILGAVAVGVGVGLCVRIGGAPSGDDALVMSISKITKIRIEWVYLFFDIVVLGLSLTYIPLKRIVYSLLTVIISGQLVGFFEKVGKKKEKP